MSSSVFFEWVGRAGLTCGISMPREAEIAMLVMGILPDETTNSRVMEHRGVSAAGRARAV